MDATQPFGTHSAPDLIFFSCLSVINVHSTVHFVNVFVKFYEKQL